MPIREFQCEACHHEWEKLNPLEKEHCPKCNSNSVRQKISVCNWNWGGLFLHWKEEKED